MKMNSTNSLEESKYADDRWQCGRKFCFRNCPIIDAEDTSSTKTRILLSKSSKNKAANSGRPQLCHDGKAWKGCSWRWSRQMELDLHHHIVCSHDEYASVHRRSCWLTIQWPWKSYSEYLYCYKSVWSMHAMGKGLATQSDRICLISRLSSRGQFEWLNELSEMWQGIYVQASNRPKAYKIRLGRRSCRIYGTIRFAYWIYRISSIIWQVTRVSLCGSRSWHQNIASVFLISELENCLAQVKTMQPPGDSVQFGIAFSSVDDQPTKLIHDSDQTGWICSVSYAHVVVLFEDPYCSLSHTWYLNLFWALQHQFMPWRLDL